MSAYLGIDIGTSGVKTLAIRPTGEVLAETSAGYPLYHPRPLWSEQNPDDWWAATVKTVRAAMRLAKLAKEDVRAIGLSGQMHGSVFLDRENRVIRPALLWNDQRTSAECQEIESRAGGRRKLIAMVANPALTGFTAPKILWLRNHEPANFERLAQVLLPKDDIRRRLTGEFATDVSDASGTLLLDVSRRDWSTKLLNKLGLDRALLPSCCESEDVTGKLTRESAKLLGLSTECLVVGGAGDCAANAVGTGVVKTGALSTSVGTSSVMFVHSDDMQLDPAGRLHTFCHAVRGKWHMMGVNLCGGGSLQWFVEQVLQGLVRQQDPYELLNREASLVPPGSEGLYFLPYLAGERTPHADPLARGSLVGLTLKHGRGHVARAIMEGATYAMRDSLEIIKQLQVPVRQIRASGGGSKSLLWRQMQADVFGQKVVTINAEQGPAFGVALLAAVGAGEYKDIRQACAATIRVVDETTVQRSAKEAYDARFVEFQQLYHSLKADFRRIAQIEG